MNWEAFPQFFVTGILTGGVYGLVGMGIVLIYKSTQVFNFAQGHLLMIGAFVAWWFAENLGLPLWVSVLGAVVAAVLIGLVVERFALRPLIGQPIFATVMMTLALSQLLQGLSLLTFGGQHRAFPELFPLQPIRLGDVVVKQNLLMLFSVAVVGFAVFGVFFRYTKAGLAMRAAAEDHQVAQSVGLNVRRIFGLAWSIAAVIATLGGILLASISGVEQGLVFIALKAFAAVLFGGLESIPGAIVGGLTIGVVESLAAGLPADPAIRALNLHDIAPYIFMLIVLIIRPDGLLGLKRIERI
jgi:branched-chain amino acid transport system permease protein